MRLYLIIEADNDNTAIQEREDVYHLIAKVAYNVLKGDDEGEIRDSKGEPIGEWSLDPED